MMWYGMIYDMIYGMIYDMIYRVCPKSHEIYFFAALLLVAACSNRLGEVGGGTLIFIAHQRSVCCENQKNPDS